MYAFQDFDLLLLLLLLISYMSSKNEMLLICNNRSSVMSKNRPLVQKYICSRTKLLVLVNGIGFTT